MTPPSPVVGTRRNVALLVLCALVAAGCVRLGLWQLDRLAARRTRNHLIASRLAAPPVPVTATPRDTMENRYRRVLLAGRFDFSHEIVLANRVRDGAPGVHLLTPLDPNGALGDTSILVDRGWVYAADGMSVDETPWREPEQVRGVGYIVPLTAGRGPSAMSSAVRPNEVRWLDRVAIERRVGRPIANYLVVIEGDTTAGAAAAGSVSGDADGQRVPRRIPPPPLDEGPHLSYAIQWFSFALIAIVGPIWGLFVAPRLRRAEDE